MATTFTLTRSGSRFTLHRSGCRYAAKARSRAALYFIAPIPLRLDAVKARWWVNHGAHVCGTCKPDLKVSSRKG